MPPLSKHSASTPDLALTVWLEELATGRRVLWIGDPSTGAADRLAAFAHSVRVLDTTGRGRSRDKGTARVSGYRSIEDLKEVGRFDLAVVPDVSVFEDFAVAAARLSDCLGDGLLLAGCDVGDDPDRAYGELGGELREAFREVRMLAEGGFHASGLVDLEADGVEVLVDDSLLGEETEPVRRFLALAADEVPPIVGHMLVQVPRGTAVLPAAKDESGPTAEREIAALRSELERSVSRLEQAQTRLIATESDLAEARSALGKGAAVEQERDIDRFERLLRERGAHVRELERELARRATLVRDITEELRERRHARPSDAAIPPGSALERALDAEAARDEARFRADELEAQLKSRQRQLEAMQDSHAGFEGRVRGYRSRIAELEELHEMSAARVRLLELDLSNAEDTVRALEGKLAETGEELELAMIKVRGAPGGESSTDLAQDLAKAREELEEATEERDRARAETLKLSAQVALAESRIEGLRLGYETRIAMLGGQPAESAEGDSERELSELRGARAGLRLRVADLEASLAVGGPVATGGAGDVDTLRADVDVLRADNGELTLRLADVEEARAEAAQRVADLTSALAARDALVTRLQMDLAEEEQAARDHDHQLRRMKEENDRLREGVLGATEAVTAREAAEAQIAQLREALASAEARAASGDSDALEALREEAAAAAKALAEAQAEAADARATISALEKRQSEAGTERAREHAEELQKLHDELAARRAEAERVSELEAAMTKSQAHDAQQSGLLADAMMALKETRKILDGLRAEREGQKPARSEITAVGAEAPDAPEAQLAQELADKETLLRSLTAQLEERDDRLRALERRLAEAPGGSEGGDAHGELLELEERVGRLQEELHHERDARSAAEQELESLSRRPDSDAELEKVRAELQTREAALDVARSRSRAAAKDVESLREVVADTRHGLEELLGAATSAGDPATAERIGALLSVLSRY